MTFEQIMEKEEFFPNDEQRPVIESNVNTVVSAGAGAGKTAVLSWRFLRLVMECSIKPEQILTLTFTKKAASEMRERIYKRLLEARESLPPDTFESFSRASISTLDSFCAQIVRSDCISYGLPRDIGVLADEDLEDLAQRLALKFLDDPGNRQEKDVISKLFMPSDLMGRFFSLIAVNTSLSGDYDAERISRSFLDHVKEIYEERLRQIGELLDALGNLDLRGKFAEQYGRIRNCYDQRFFTEADYFDLRGVRDEEVKEIAGRLKPLMGKDSGFVVLQNLVREENKEVSLLQRTVEKYSTMLNDEKRRQGTLSFKDMSDLAVCILRDNLQLRNVFKKRFKQIMVDEFQDNNMNQRDLVFLLAEKENLRGTEGGIPKVEDLDGSKLFFVGDEKQSIYRFRGADVSVFRSLQKEMASNGKTLELGTNYRSQAKLIDHFNRVFRTVLASGGKSFEAHFSPMKAGRKPDKTKSRIIFGVYNRDSIEDDELKDGVLEAEAIGDYCRRILYTDEFLVNGERPKASDVAILFGTSSNQMNIEKALKRRGIGYQIAETRSLMLDAVASDFYAFINCLLYPEDTRSRVALLKSPFCGLCEKSIENVLSESEVLEIDSGRYGAFRLFFESVKEVAFRLTITQLLEKIYIEGGYKAYLSQDQDRLSFREHYDYLYCYAAQYDAEGRSLADYARFLRDNLGASEKLPESNLLHAQKSGVQVMTVHKSKGLDFKVVIYAGIGSKGANDKATYVFNYGGELIASEILGIQKILEQERKEREEAETRRLMYVAMTRAKDHLIVVGGYKKKTMSNVFSWYLNAIGGNLSTLECDMEGVEMEDLGGTTRAPKVSSDMDDGPDRKPDFVEFETRTSRIGVTALEDPEGEDDTGTPGVPLPVFEVDGMIGQAGLNDRFGTLCHEALELLVKEGDMSDLRSDLFESEKDNRKVLDQAKAFAEGFLGSFFYKKHIQGRRLESEVRFYTGKGTPEGTVLEGVIDLVVFGRDYNLIVDYKTDRFKAPGIHKRQVVTYVDVSQQIYGKPCYGVLYYLRDGSLSEFWDSEGKTWRPDSEK